MSAEATVLTRIIVDAEGNLIVTDLWDEVRELLGESFEEETAS